MLARRVIAGLMIAVAAAACGDKEPSQATVGASSAPVSLIPDIENSPRDFLLHSLADYSSCVEVTGASLDNGADIATAPCTGAPEQQWRFIKKLVHPPGSYRIRNVNSRNKCMRARGDAEVVQGACRWKRSKWLASDQGTSLIQLVSAKTGLCATVADGTVIQAGCIGPDPDPSQLFAALPVECPTHLVNEAGWVGCDAELEGDNPVGIQGSFFTYGDDIACSPAPGNPCTSSGCCLAGSTIVDPEYLAWGCALGLELNSTGGSTPVVSPYDGAANCFDLTLTGSSGGNPVHIGYTQYEASHVAPTAEVFPFVEIPAVAGSWSGTVCFDAVGCPAASVPDSCAITGDEYHLLIAVPGGERDADFNLCLTSLVPSVARDCPTGWFGEECDRCVVYVNAATGDDQGTDPDAGRSWALPLASVTRGIEVAAPDGCEVWVAATAADYMEHISLVDNVGVYGGFDGTETERDQRDWMQNETVLNGANEAGSVVSCSVSDGCGNGAVIDGFTIINGNAARGGGMYNYFASPTVTNCTFSGNHADLDGAGMYNERSSPTVTNCVFSSNEPDGMLNRETSSPTVTDGTFSDHVGPGMTNNASSPEVTNCTFSGNGESAMYNSNGSSPTVSECVFSGNYHTAGGGMRNSSSSPTVHDCLFTENTALTSGGGMHNVSSSPTLVGCTFTDNSAIGRYDTRIDGYGGGMYSLGSSVVVTGCSFIGNATAYAGDGGGMYNEESTVQVTNCSFSFNSANEDGAGGGMYSESSSVTVTGSTFSENAARWLGGGIASRSTPAALTVAESHFIDNSVRHGGGGGIYSAYGTVTVTDSTFSGNTARDEGGGLYSSYDSDAVVTNCTFSDNRATGNSGQGGAIHNGGDNSAALSTVMLATGCTFSGNSAGAYGGGLFNGSSAVVTVTNCVFGDNSAGIYGGGLYHAGDRTPSGSPGATVTNCTFSGNSASDSGGGLAVYSGAPMVTNCTFFGNVASVYGGGMHHRGSATPTVTNCIVWGNSAASGPEIYNDGAEAVPVVTYSDVAGGYVGTGNIDLEPLFEADSLRLQAGSPCIDAGRSGALPPDAADLDADADTSEPVPYDLDGADRIQGAAVDQGAYEHDPGAG